MYEITTIVNSEVIGYYYDHNMVKWYIMRYMYNGKPVFDLDKDMYKSQNREVVIDALVHCTPHLHITRIIDFIKKQNALFPGGVHTYETS